MDTYFIRHTWQLNITEATRDDLIATRRIALHSPNDRDGRWNERDNDSLDPESHKPSDRNKLRRFWGLAREGGYVCAEYHGLKGCLIGKIPPGTPVETVYGFWRDLPHRPAALQTLRLEMARVVPTDAAASILVARPRQGTFMRWHKAKRAILRLVEGLTEKLTLDDLSADQQEVLCSEFLRSEAATALGLPRLAHLVRPVGRTMKDLDLLALATDGRPIFAQVTYSEIAHAGWKRDRLAPYAGKGHCLLFAHASEITTDRGVTVVPISSVFDWLMRSDLGAAWFMIAAGEDLSILRTAAPGSALD